MSDDDDDINSYIPSLLNPRTFKWENAGQTQKSILSSKSILQRKKLKDKNSLQEKTSALENQPKTIPTNQDKVLNNENLSQNSFAFCNKVELNNNYVELCQSKSKNANGVCTPPLSNHNNNECSGKNSAFNVTQDTNLGSQNITFVNLIDTSDICEDAHVGDNNLKHHSADVCNYIDIKKKKIDNNFDSNTDSFDKYQTVNKVSNKIQNSKSINGSQSTIILESRNVNGDLNKQPRIKFESDSLEDTVSLDCSDYSNLTIKYSVTENIKSEECIEAFDDMNKVLRVGNSSKYERNFSKSTSCSPTSSSRQTRLLNSSGDKDVPSRVRQELATSALSRRKSSCSIRSNASKNVSHPKIPYYKIVAGTHFAVDAFSYGDIKNVKHYFLTHFHSDHYCGLKKSFDKTLFCSKITADLCISRLGVSSKCIQILQLDETIRIEDVEVTAVDANHCPGSVMLIFALPNDKTILHTGDFRATPLMESYPIFWNKTIYTVYLDTTYCHKRFQFPTQDECIEMAVEILKEKKRAVEKERKLFSSVLVVCGTYTIGKEKFFLGLSRRIGSLVWAPPEKQKVLRTCCNMFTTYEPAKCQLHVLPMRDICYEKLRDYLASMGGVFTEVVAFKPSGWERNHSTKHWEQVTIHGIPYSEHSSFSELERFIKFLKPKQIVPTVDTAGGVDAIQKNFACPVVHGDNISQTRIPEFFSKNKKRESNVT